MAKIKITDLPSATSITNDDLLIIVDSGNPYVTKKISWGNIDAPSGVITYGRLNNQWVDITSPANLQVRRGTASEVSGIIPLQGEPVWDTTNKILYVGDESTYGGIPVAYPTKAYKFTSLPGGNTSSWFSISLGPQNSVWEFDIYADFDLLEEGNATATFSFSSSTNIQSLVGALIYIDNTTNTAQHFSLANSDIICNVASDGETLKVNGMFTVSSTTGTLVFTEQNDNHERGANIAYVKIRRII
jgi:hypothetical protein